MQELIALKSVNAGYGNQLILEDINFKVHSNDFIGIIGPNGGGKTTLLKIILGLLEPFNGDIQYKGKPGNKKNLRIGYLPQTNTFDKKYPISVLEVVLSGLMGNKGIWGKYSKKDKDFALELLDSVGIADYQNKQIGELSGGQLQRSFLCRALISNPELLILDEPNTYVDNKFEGELYEYLKELNKSIGIVMVSHDVGTISSYIKSIACVNRKLHHHESNLITNEQLVSYNCPIQIISHGEVPHTVLKHH